MNCPETPENLSHYIDGDVTEAERLEVERHISECVACAQYVEAFRNVGERLAAEPRVRMPDDAVARLAAVVDANLDARKKTAPSVASAARDEKSESWWRLLFTPAVGGAVASLAVVAMAVVVWSGGTDVTLDSGAPSLQQEAPRELDLKSSGSRKTLGAEAEDEAKEEGAAAESDGDGLRSESPTIDEDGLRSLAEGTDFADVLAEKGKVLSGKPNAPEGAADAQLFDTITETASGVSAEEAIKIAAAGLEVENILATRALFQEQEVWVVVLAPIGEPDAQFAAAVTLGGKVLFRTD